MIYNTKVTSKGYVTIPVEIMIDTTSISTSLESQGICPLDFDYVKWIHDVKQRYITTQIKATVKVNTEQLKTAPSWYRIVKMQKNILQYC